MDLETLVPGGEELRPDKNFLNTEIQESLFSIWFNSVVVNGPKRREYKVPFKIQTLPCGCHRSRTSESDPNNTWHIKRKGSNFNHKECGQELN